MTIRGRRQDACSTRQLYDYGKGYGGPIRHKQDACSTRPLYDYVRSFGGSIRRRQDACSTWSLRADVAEHLALIPRNIEVLQSFQTETTDESDKVEQTVSLLYFK